GLAQELRRALAIATGEAEAGGAAFGGEYIGLDFAERDRSRGEPAVRMGDGVRGILPALVGEALARTRAIFEEAVAIGIAIGVDPAQRRLDIGPDCLDGLEVAGALEIAAGQIDEERRRIDAAIIECEGHFAEARHLAAP